MRPPAHTNPAAGGCTQPPQNRSPKKRIGRTQLPDTQGPKSGRTQPPDTRGQKSGPMQPPDAEAQKSGKSYTPATRAPVDTDMKADGSIAAGIMVARQPIIELACMGNMDDTASTGENTIRQATAVARTARAADITAEANTAHGPTDEPGIIDAAGITTTGPAQRRIPEQS